MRIFSKTALVCATVALAIPCIVNAQDLLARASVEGRVSIYTSTDISQSQPMVDAFSKKYPNIKVDYNDIGTVNTYNRLISEKAANQVGADVAWTSAMDLQMQLAVDGYFQAVNLKEAENIPKWGKYKNLLYATSVGPIGMLYNTNALSEAEVPKTRIELIEFLKSDKAKNRVATFDPAKSGSGFLHHTNDLQNTDNFWELAEAFGQAKGKTYSSSGAMKETVVSGENILAFNLIGAFAIDWAKDSSSLGAAFEQERTAAYSSLIGLTEGAPHPAAGQLFIEFVLSHEGQAELAKKGIPSIRADVTEGFNRDTINARVGGNLKLIAIDESLLDFLEPMKRVEFLKKWDEVIR